MARSYVRLLFVVQLTVIGGGGGCISDDERPSSNRYASTSTGYVVFAHSRVIIDRDCVVSGQIGVRDASGGGTSIQIKASSAITGGLIGDAIELQKDVQVQGPVQTNAMTAPASATLSEPVTSPLELPLPDITPELPDFAPGSTNVSVAAGTAVQLAPGAYGKVTLTKAKASPSAPTVLRLTRRHVRRRRARARRGEPPRVRRGLRAAGQDARQGAQERLLRTAARHEPDSQGRRGLHRPARRGR